MTSENTSIPVQQIRDTAGHLAAILAAIDKGELTATPVGRARIEGGLVALQQISGAPQHV